MSLAYRLYKRQTNTQNGLNILSLSYSLSLRKKLFEYTSENEINPPLRPQKLNPKKRLKTEKIAKNTTNPVQNPVTNTVDTYKPNTKTSAETSLRQRESIFHALNVLAAEKRTVRFVFNNERLFEAALHREAERFLNRQGRFAAALALFLNALFVTDDNARPPLRYSDCLRGFEGELSAAVELVRYVREPELFEKILLALLAEGHLTANIKAPDAAATLLRKLVDAQKTLGGRVTGEPAGFIFVFCIIFLFLNLFINTYLALHVFFSFIYF